MKINIQGQPYGADKAVPTEAGTKKFWAGHSRLERVARNRSASRASRKVNKQSENVEDLLQEVDNMLQSVKLAEETSEVGASPQSDSVAEEGSRESVEHLSPVADDAKESEPAVAVGEKAAPIASIMASKDDVEPELPQGVQQKKVRRARPKLNIEKKKPGTGEPVSAGDSSADASAMSEESGESEKLKSAKKSKGNKKPKESAKSKETKSDVRGPGIRKCKNIAEPKVEPQDAEEEQHDITEPPEESDSFVAKFLLASMLIFGAVGAFATNMMIQGLLG